MTTPFIDCRSFSYAYTMKGKLLPVLDDISLSLQSGETLAILGASGSGKSTLLHLLGFLDRPTRGAYFWRGKEMTHAKASELAVLRNREIGFVFQAFHLISHLSALENVALPLLYRGVFKEAARAQAKDALIRVGLGSHLVHRPSELSGGQAQRVAIARAFVGKPSLILADEPTGNLDGQSAADVLHLLHDLNRDAGTSLVMVTHHLTLASQCARRVEVCNGRVREVLA